MNFLIFNVYFWSKVYLQFCCIRRMIFSWEKNWKNEPVTDKESWYNILTSVNSIEEKGCCLFHQQEFFRSLDHSVQEMTVIKFWSNECEYESVHYCWCHYSQLSTAIGITDHWIQQNINVWQITQQMTKNDKYKQQFSS